MITIRFKFERKEKLRFISHLDQQRLFQRAFRRAGMPLAYSGGFNPHPRLSFALAMSVGMLSDCEYGDIVLEKDMDLKDFVRNLNSALPEGIQILEARKLPPRTPSLTASLQSSTYRLQVALSETISCQEIAEIFDQYLSRAEIIVEKRNKKGKYVPKNIRPYIEDLKVIEILQNKAVLEMTLKYIEQQSVKPELVLETIQSERSLFLLNPTMILRRTELKLNE